MILSLPETFPWGKPTEFKAMTQAGAKLIHIVGCGKNTWTPGAVIDFMIESEPPDFFHLFQKELADNWIEQEGSYNKPTAAATEIFRFSFKDQKKSSNVNVEVSVGNMALCHFSLLEMFAIVCGYSNSAELCNHYISLCRKNERKHFIGQIIHQRSSTVFDTDTATYA